MTVAFICILIAIFIPLVLAGYAKIRSKGYDNSAPREFLQKLEGAPKRANYAQMNAYEVFPPFAAGVLIAYGTGAPQNQIDLLAVIFVIARVLYSWAYVTDHASLRTLFWVIGLGCTVGFFVISF